MKQKLDRKQEQRNNEQTGNDATYSEGSSEFLIDGMDTVALSQFLATRGTQWDLQPEEKLMLAVLEDAIDCFRKNLFAGSEKRSTLFREAEEWILTEEDTYLFSFNSICEVFDIDPAYLRRGLMNYKRAEQSKRAA